MPNSYYNHGTYPAPGAPGQSAAMRSELDLITAGFSLLPTLSLANAGKALILNPAGDAITLTTGKLLLAGDVTFTGAFSTSFTASAGVTLALPGTSGTLALITGTVALATALAGGLANQIPYQSAPGVTAFNSGLTFDGTTLTAAALGVTNATTLTGLLTVNGSIAVPTAKQIGGTGTAKITGFASIAGTSFWPGFRSNATGSGAITLVATDAQEQEFTGAVALTHFLPVATTMTQGQGFTFINSSTAVQTIKSSGAANVQVMSPGTTVTITCVNPAGGTGAASWSAAATSSGQMYGNAASKAIFWNATTISEDITILTGTEGFSAGSPSITPGYGVTIESNAGWTIVS